MIQPPALTPASLLAPTGEAAPALNGDAVQGADFGALLAISVTPPVAVGEAIEIGRASCRERVYSSV